MQFDWLPKAGVWMIPYIVVIILIIGILATIWLGYHVGYEERISYKKTAIALIILSLCYGYVIHYILAFLGVY